jgi:hypothetical protein
MAALLGAVTVLGVAGCGLVAWRWWLADKAAARTERVAVDQAKLDSLPVRLMALEQRVTDVEWRAKK